MWSEIEELVQAHAETSAEHAQILEILANCKPNYTEYGAQKRKKQLTSQVSSANMATHSDM